MLLGALLDAGARLDAVVDAVEAVLPRTVRLVLTEVRRAGMRAAKLDVAMLEPDQDHRDWSTIRELLAAADLAEPVRSAAHRVFSALAEAEARVHGTSPEEVHFHEVGAWDSIADVVGVCAAIHDLGLAWVACGTVGLGSGTVRSAHGVVPVPVPAVLELAAGWPVIAGGAGELATPTGMALVTTLAVAHPDLPPGRIERVGLGAGTRDDPERPNVVRVVLGRFGPADELPTTRSGVVLEANVDDLDPRLWPDVLGALLSRGADDAWLVPILMKKGRPAHTLHVLARPEAVDDLRNAVFELVPTLGVRESPVRKTALERAWVEVDVGAGRARIKVGHRDGRILTATPEFSDVTRLAEVLGLAQRDALAAAIAAAGNAGLVPGATFDPDEG